MAYDTLPEVQQFDDIMRSIYKDFCLTKLKGKSSMTVVAWEQALMRRCVQPTSEKLRLCYAVP